VQGDASGVLPEPAAQRGDGYGESSPSFLPCLCACMTGLRDVMLLLHGWDFVGCCANGRGGGGLEIVLCVLLLWADFPVGRGSWIGSVDWCMKESRMLGSKVPGVLEALCCRIERSNNAKHVLFQMSRMSVAGVNGRVENGVMSSLLTPMMAGS